MLTHALEADPAIEVVGVAANGIIALARIEQLKPDAVTLDIEMPEMNGFETLKQIRLRHDHIRVIMFSTLTERGASATLEALAAGADDYVTKNSNQGSFDHSLDRLRAELIPKIKQFFAVAKTPPPALSLPAIEKRPAPSAPFIPRAIRGPHIAPAVIVIGVSTGGPAALARIMPSFPAGFPVPILIVQHMPPLFTKLLADRLNDICPLHVREASEGALISPGDVWIAPGDFHMRIALRGKELRIRLDQGPPENSCRPAVDVLFASAAAQFESRVLAAVLTGMGRDGQRGAALLKAKGATVLAQDEESCVVWGMPGSVVQDGSADAVVPLDEIPNEIMARIPGCLFLNRASNFTGKSSVDAPGAFGRMKEAPCPR